IGRQNFNHRSRVELLNRVDRLSKMSRASVRQIVARYGGNDYVFEAHPPSRFANSCRFVGLQSERFGCCHRAETTSSRAAVAGDHESSCPFAPAFPMVGTTRALANRM